MSGDLKAKYHIEERMVAWKRTYSMDIARLSAAGIDDDLVRRLYEAAFCDGAEEVLGMTRHG